MVLVDQRYWRDFQGEFPPDLRVLEKIRIQGHDLFIVRRELTTLSSRRVGRPPIPISYAPGRSSEWSALRLTF